MSSISNVNPNIKHYADGIENEHNKAEFFQAYGAFMRLRDIVAKSMIDMACQLHLIRKLLPNEMFFDFADDILGLKRSSVFNYIKVYDGALKLFNNSDRLDYETAGKLSLKAYRIIDKIDDDALLTDIRKLVENSGDSINLDQIRTLIDSRNNEIELQLAEAIADAESLKTTLEAERSAHAEALQQKEFVILQQKNQLVDLDRVSAKLNEQKHLLEKEIQKLRKQPPKVITKEVPVLPAEFTKLEDALSHLDKLLQIKKEQVESLDKQLAEKHQQFELLDKQHVMLEPLIKELESITSKWSDIQLYALTDDVRIRSHIQQYGQVLIRFGQFLLGKT